MNLHSKTIYFFDAEGALMDTVTYHACRNVFLSAAEYADEIGAADYDSELPEVEDETQVFLEAAQ